MYSLESLPDPGAGKTVTHPAIGNWRRNRYRTHGCNVEELRAWRREHESALRSERRLQQLISKRLLHEDPLNDEGQIGTDTETAAPLTEEEVSQLLKNIRKGTEDRAVSLRRLRQGLRHKETQQKFIRLEGSMRVLIGLFTSNMADLQMDAARCLHELSHSSDPDVAGACLPATSYLLTYLSGHSIPLMELCLYTLGNLVVEMKAVKKQLLPQGIIPVLASCIQSPHVVVQEGVGYVLSQLLQSREAPTEIMPLILDSTIPQNMLRLVCSNLEEGMGAAVEFAWGLHYIICSQVNNSLLISQNIIPSLVHLLLNLASMISTTSAEGLEVLICPVVRCVANLLSEDEVESGQLVEGEEHLLRAMFVFIQYFFHKQLYIVQEALWLINNLTADSTIACSALLNLDLIPSLLQLIHSHQMVSSLVLTVLCNVAAKGVAYCQTLQQKAVLASLVGILALPGSKVTVQVLELLHLLFIHWPETITDFVHQSGLQALQQHEDDLRLQDQVKALIQIISQPAALLQDCSLADSAEELQLTCLKI
ncbi:transmembrane and coiled-coil domain-containing protein 6 isoform X1 [Anolis carolinensis]|uniref:Transmembrane and coiled-coil domains 6 n=2 Tax=Anolis carolinensis TaxID=28377 RepID=G1KN27_ANOCA|nr:PREDICTED: transmembrane and coiled-coil domain-containing protein 6 isoform X1 [Anolis carolinensis]XP_008107233.1 PREDICTED: transmembrane and coiled-coil domain-containing protein 6 isoform X1 [Anolis carolinensis]|eukprot:XP_003219939.1 PREDICTED: transmembrane and coiled-coil domain-containing protein 6 isoform X1 [Anolis carolinensis]